MSVGYLHMQRQIDAERKRQQVKKVASAKLEKLPLKITTYRRSRLRVYSLLDENES